MQQKTRYFEKWIIYRYAKKTSQMHREKKRKKKKNDNAKIATTTILHSCLTHEYRVDRFSIKKKLEYEINHQIQNSIRNIKDTFFWWRFQWFLFSKLWDRSIFFDCWDLIQFDLFCFSLFYKNLSLSSFCFLFCALMSRISTTPILYFSTFFLQRLTCCWYYKIEHWWSHRLHFSR